MNFSSSPYFLEPDLSESIFRARAARLYSELNFSLSRIEKSCIRQWGTRSASRLVFLAGRRVGGLTKLLSVLARTGSVEVLGLISAIQRRDLSQHLTERAAATIDGGISLGRDGAKMLAGLAKAMIHDPKRTATLILGGLLGFEAGSGGLDGNGGIPDLDLLAGIQTHRSPLTHSIVAGIVVEGLLLAIADLAAEVHGKLPIEHDPLWDGLAKIGRPLTQSLALGTSAGLAYHLFIDAFVQPGAYHDLPVSMSIVAHEAIQAVNGVAEGADAAKRAVTGVGSEIHQQSREGRSTGLKIVQAAKQTAASVGATTAGMASDFYTKYLRGH
jgi:hypothetical protein